MHGSSLKKNHWHKLATKLRPRKFISRSSIQKNITIRGQTNGPDQTDIQCTINVDVKLTQAQAKLITWLEYKLLKICSMHDEQSHTNEKSKKLSQE